MRKYTVRNKLYWLTLPSLTLLMLTVVGLLANSQDDSIPEWVPGRDLLVAVAEIVTAVAVNTEGTEYGYDEGISVLGALLKPNRDVTIRRPLVAGTSYLFVGGGDEDVEDVDIHLIDLQGNEVGKDNKRDAGPVVSYTPSQSGMYDIRLRLYKASVECFCILVILQKGGYDVPLGNLAIAVGKTVACWTQIAILAEEGGFHDEPNQWTLYGTILNPKRDITVTNLTVETRKHMIFATGDDNAEDIDIFLLDDKGQILASDEEPNSVPAIEYRTGGHPSYGLRIKNVRSDGATLVIATILDI